ncbi:MAG TPA: enoyl-CoA hydratase-related protein [Steroidobacteraceae bacterium]|jgi:2-(1,2-epoxy-1,2-dihydrophenyl)acetyl-CoA isomerase|nr:enoyl-CoA hydratase-related protein [Steroidobacteraceae bacterium]
MEFATLLFERRESIAYVTLNRPDRLNALSLKLVEDLHAAAVAIEADREIRAVLLTGAGRAFSSGADLMRDDFLDASRSSHGEKIGAGLREHFNPMVSAWYNLSVPVVVAVNGVAAGAGMSLALVGDIVLAAHSATFLQLFAPKVGLMPDLGSTYHLPRLVGTARAKGLTLLGDALSATDAERWGLIWACVDDAALQDRAEALARRFAAGPTQAFKRIKGIFNREPAATLSEQLALEALAQTELGDTRDFMEGVLAFRGKRAPRFSGE